MLKFLFAAVMVQLALSGPVKNNGNDQLQEYYAKPHQRATQNIWQLSGLYEGDIVISLNTRNGATNASLRWPNREIPYAFSEDFILNLNYGFELADNSKLSTVTIQTCELSAEQERQYIADTLETEFGKTCVTVRPRKATDSDYVYITGKNTGCSSVVGRTGGAQLLNLQGRGYGCIQTGTIAHEFLHAAGFYHQQSALGRDNYVYILKENIEEGKEDNFDEYESDSFGEPYDYDSVMHYDAFAFSWNGQPTVVPKNPYASIGQRIGLSPIDIRKLNKMYECSDDNYLTYTGGNFY